jgi:hypothetical protein
MLGFSQDAFYPIIFGRPFLHTIGVEIDLPKESILLNVLEKGYSLIFLSLLIRS